MFRIKFDANRLRYLVIKYQINSFNSLVNIVV
nr:MAG TPA: hypothetical protein [Caudoviricetes sp.]